jgi:Ca2+-binding EF-hand superfamily protein
VLLLPGAKEPFRLRLDVVLDGRSPDTAWEGFLDRLFDWFDRDGDGALSKAEVARMFPLPLPGRRELAIEFARLDTDGDGKASRTELKAYCRRNGFGPVVVEVEGPSAADARLAELFLRRLDTDGDGKLTKVEWQQAADSLRGCDLNDDEFLDLAELLALAPPGLRPGKPQLAVGETARQTDTVLRLDLGGKAISATLHGGEAKSLRLVVCPEPGGVHRLHGREGRWVLGVSSRHSPPDVQSAGEFLIAQFRAALGDRAALSRADLEDDPVLSGLQELLRYADRKEKGRLTLAELRDYLSLIQQGAQAQVWVHVTDHDRNPFPSWTATATAA